MEEFRKDVGSYFADCFEILCSCLCGPVWTSGEVGACLDYLKNRVFGVVTNEKHHVWRDSDLKHRVFVVDTFKTKGVEYDNTLNIRFCSTMCLTRCVFKLSELAVNLSSYDEAKAHFNKLL